ncbi:MAG: ATP-binding cassette domain-containing protein, partial [Desulfobacterales bacterium]|nr:ATP-binding cassette domain-containing protein [Desulfobacterales bacterium]
YDNGEVRQHYWYDTGVDVVSNSFSLLVTSSGIINFVGASGTGKSTIISLICGFFKLQTGSLKIFGQELSKWEISSLRSLISVVSQDIFLFPTSIAENIGYGRLGASEAEIIRASKLAGSHDFIKKMPESYNTLIGERGIKLSGGERQRISLARAILKDTPIFLLDEPTSALDSESEALVKNALTCLAPDCTVVVIAHRLSTIKWADQILVLDQGKIVECGTHAKLLKNEGIYFNLFSEQFNTTMLNCKGGG